MALFFQIDASYQARLEYISSYTFNALIFIIFTGLNIKKECAQKNLIDMLQSICYKVSTSLRLSALEELKDITGGLDQRITMYKSRLQELQKKRDRIEDEITTIKKYLELAETLYRLEAGRAKLPNLPNQIPADTDKDKPVRQASLTDVTDQSREILLGRSKYVGMNVSEAAYLVLRDAGAPLHAKDICHRLIEGGLRIKAKAPVTSIATSLKRDRRFRKVGPNTFAAVEEKLQAV